MIRRRLSVHLAVLVLGAAVVRIAIVPAEVCPAVTPAQVEESIDAAVAWIVDGQDGSGRYRYGHDLTTGLDSPSYNEARHAGVTMSLDQAQSERGRPEILAAADRALELALADLFDGPGWSAWHTVGDVQAGSNGLLLAALALRREVTGESDFDAAMRGIGRFLLSQQQADGSIHTAWDPRTGTSVARFGPFSTGQAAWAFALLDRAFPGEGWGDAAARTIDYMAGARNATEGHLVSLPDHWAAYALADLHPDLLTDARIDYARRLAGYFGVRLRFEAQRRGTGLNLWVRWYPGPPAGVGTAGEGLGALRRLARHDPRLADLIPGMDARLTCMAGYQYGRQVLAPGSPTAEYGAWFYRGYTQMDDQQHMLSALLSAWMVMEEGA